MISITELLNGTATSDDVLRPSSDAKASGPVIVWSATRTCNLECEHCHSSAERKHIDGELTTDEAKAMIDDLATFDVPALILSGGEPLVRSDIVEIADHARSKGIRVTLSTNGTLITPELASNLKKVGINFVGVSIDGTEATHDRLRGRNGAYADAVRGIRNARAAGLRVGVRFTATAANVAELSYVFRFVETENVDRLTVQHIVFSSGDSPMTEIALSAAETRAMMDCVMEQAESWLHEGKNIELITVDNNADGPYTYLWLLEHDPNRAMPALDRLKDGGSGNAPSFGAVDNFGNVYPDQFLQKHPIGNVRERKFSAIWNEPNDRFATDLRERSVHLLGRCSTCLWLDVCNGNYRARAEASTGNRWESDPGCYLADQEITPNFLGGGE